MKKRYKLLASVIPLYFFSLFVFASPVFASFDFSVRNFTSHPNSNPTYPVLDVDYYDNDLVSCLLIDNTTNSPVDTILLNNPESWSATITLTIPVKNTPTGWTPDTTYHLSCAKSNDNIVNSNDFKYFPAPIIDHVSQNDNLIDVYLLPYADNYISGQISSLRADGWFDDLGYGICESTPIDNAFSSPVCHLDFFINPGLPSTNKARLGVGFRTNDVQYYFETDDLFIVKGIQNQPPSVSAFQDATLNEGETHTTTGQIYDGSSYALTAIVDYGDGSGVQPLPLIDTAEWYYKNFSLNHQYTTAGEYTVTVSVTDDQDATGSHSALVTVNPPNDPPQVNVLSGAMINKNDTYSENGSFTDPSSASWTATVDYGEGSGVQVLSLSGTEFSLNHQYTNEGTFTVSVTVTDNQNESDSETTIVTVVNADPVTVTFNASGDAYVKSGQDNHNYGAGLFMNLQSSGSNRAIVKFDQNNMSSIIGSGTILSAKLRLTITDNGNNWGTTGRTVDVHRMVASWDEGNGTESNHGTGAGATWNCAIDSNIHNQAKNCSGSAEWQMGQPNNPSIHPWNANATDTKTITNNQSGVVEFDVTNDVTAFMNGTNNYGWILKKTNEGQNGQVSFGTRESSSVPQLVVTYQP